MVFSLVLNSLLKKHDLTVYRLAKETGISTGLLSYWVNGQKSPSVENLIKISEYFHISTDYLLFGNDALQNKKIVLKQEEKEILSKFRNATETVKLIVLFALEKGQLTNNEVPFEDTSESENYMIPILGRAAAGLPTEMIENDFGQVKVDDPAIHNADFAVYASGDSMIDAGINDGDIIIIHRQQELETQGQIALIAVDDSSTIKRFYQDDEQYRLVPENPKYDVQIYPKSANIRILGKVVKVIGKPN